MMRKLVPILLAGALSLVAGACSGKPAEKPAPRPAFEVVRDIRAGIKTAADARQAEAEREGRRVIWRPRLETCLLDLDGIIAVLQKHGTYGPPQDEQADELMRASFDLGQAAECDPRLAAAMRPHVVALMLASKQLRRFSVPG
jgi:hypothetical protein